MTITDAAPPTSGAAPTPGYKLKLALTIVVHGDPAAQGSKAYKGHRTNRRTGRSVAVLVEQSKKVAPWRSRVTEAADEARIVSYDGLQPVRRPQITGPVFVDVTFTVGRPKRVPAARLGLPSTRPDVDKMIRALFDGITDSKAWQDDGLVVDVAGRKSYPGIHPSALDEPGAVVHIWEVVP